MKIFKKLKQSLFGSKKTSKAKPKKKASPRKAKKAKVVKKRPPKKAAPKKKMAKAAPKIKGKLLGRVTHYFPHVQAAVVQMESGSLRLGDTIYIKGHTTDFKQSVRSIQINHKPIEEAKKGDEIGLQVQKRVREHDQVYKI
jgi:putative protease